MEKVQDETHRFTIEYQRSRHTKTSIRSSLLDIPGIGETRAKSLLARFKTLDALKTADVGELKTASGMSESAAQAVFEYFHS
ncbi:MAG: helix-hairpin-helix domain-containing protein [Oscillospiraceae bacterium]